MEEGSFEDLLKVNNHTRRRRRKSEARSQKPKEEELGISLLPRPGPSQTFEAWLRVPGEDDVPGRAECLVADDHLHFEGKLGGDPEESPGVRVGGSLVNGHKGVRVEDHQGKEVANEVFSQAWLAGGVDFLLPQGHARIHL